MLNLSTNPASTNTVLSLQRIMVEVRAYDNMAREGDENLLECAYCLDAPTFLPAGYDRNGTGGWVRR